jgi:uncharacterized phiE125 gp8 family phage protein
VTALAALKSHLNLTDLAASDDSDLTLKLDAAILYTSDRVEIDGGNSLTWDNAPADLKHAILMLAAHWYANREAILLGVQSASTPYGFDDLVRPYKPTPWVF